MATINETQRKYLVKRVEELKNTKISQIRLAYAAEPYDMKRKTDIIEAGLSRIGWTMTSSYSYIITPYDIEYKEKQTEAQQKQEEKIVEFRTLANKVLDTIILGSESEEINTALQELVNFN